jgi:hypothetical protein
MTRLHRPAVATLLLTALAGGCATYQPPLIFAGFMSPQVSCTSCIDAVRRYYKMPAESVKPLGDAQTLQEGFYVATLSITGQPNVPRTVNENGVVLDVVRAQ